ncbi:hypothetical protein KP509_29G039700 [Ceratopteris richardii]|uniref:Uncharacterized protein n=1 Tax=Ceratopteris richardii TaxID=49495 RepID=A0A8T2R7G1_CERRI|nr:hypothetical protein KP509_29G039700 [Ceratopteris richardii]
MVSATTVADNDKELLAQDDGYAHGSFKRTCSESVKDGYDSDSGKSEFSVTSGWSGHFDEEDGFFIRNQVVHSRTDESAETTWTDEKHSSYLDSMESTFVQKMYDKEYCSLDVCGHSSRSSLSLDQDSVDSQAFYLNMRKPLKWNANGLLTLKAPSLSNAPSVLASPWIQHFKCRRSLSVGYSQIPQEAAEHPCSTVLRKARLSSFRNCKRLRTELLELAELDVQIDKQHQLQVQDHNNVQTRQTEPKAEPRTDGAFRKEVESPNETTYGELCAQIHAKAIPLFQTVSDESSGKDITDDPAGLDGGKVSISQTECVVAQSGSKTWTWSFQGPRYHVVRKPSSHAFH